MTTRGTDRPYADELIDLGLTRDADNIPTLVRALKSEQVQVRIAAVRALGWLRKPTVAALLLPMLNDQEPAVRRWTASSLALCGQMASASMLRASMADESSPVVRASIARALGWLGDQGSVDDLSRWALHDSCGQVRGASLQALIRLNTPLDLAFLLTACDDPDSAVRIQALRGLAHGSGKEIESTLDACVLDPDPHIRVFAIRALVAIGAARAREHCLLALQDSNPGVRCAGLIGIRDGAFKLDGAILLPCLQDSHPEVRQQARLTKSAAEFSRVETERS
ncbi:MAG: HEAT repeat domain-containing protein [Myxococcota bacterium]|nr:HEAT repeat domain-containing protein [Myxococcota bacterium]